MRIILSLVLVFSFFIIAIGQTKPDNTNIVSEDEQVLRELANKWIEADVKGDAPTVNSLLADEFAFFNGMNRAQYLASMNPDPTLVVESAVIENQQVQIYGETAIVTGLNSYKIKKDGRPVIAKFPSMTVWVKKGRRWQCVKACTLPALTN